MKKRLKLGLLLTLITGLVAPSSAFAASDYEKELDAIYGPENGSVTFKEPSDISLFSRYGKIFWDASYVTTTHYQIPKDITIPNAAYNSIRINSSATTNTSSSTTQYDVTLESYSSWSGGWVSKNSVTIPVNVSRYEYFENLSTSDRYRLRIKGNVKGNITVYEQTG